MLKKIYLRTPPFFSNELLKFKKKKKMQCKGQRWAQLNRINKDSIQLVLNIKSLFVHLWFLKKWSYSLKYI